MSTSIEAVGLLDQALDSAKKAVKAIDGLIVEHEYQDVASLVAKAAAALLEASSQLVKLDDEAAVELLEKADDFLDSVYSIIDGEVDDEDEE